MAISSIHAKTQERVDKGPACTVCATLEGLPDSERDALVALLADTSVRYSWLSDQLMNEGIDIHPNTLGRHAAGRCAARTKLRK